MIDQAAVRLEFRNRLLDMDEGPDEAVLKIDNRDFTPPDDGSLWVRETLIPGDEQLIANNELELLAILQYDCFVPTNTGTTEADEMARRIGEEFKPTVGFAAGSDDQGNLCQVTVYRASLLQPQENVGDNFYMRSIRIFFRAYAQNHSLT